MIIILFFLFPQERIFKNYQNIKFFPDQFTQYLLSPEVGFSKCEVVSIPPHPSKGFQRPLHLFTKALPVKKSSVYTPMIDSTSQYEEWEKKFNGFQCDPPLDHGCIQRSLDATATAFPCCTYDPFKTPVYDSDCSSEVNSCSPVYDPFAPHLPSPPDDYKMSEELQDNSNPSEEAGIVETMEEETSSEFPSDHT